MKRTSRILRAFWGETIKRIPYILLILALLLGVSGVVSYRKTVESVNVSRENSGKITTQTSAIERNTAAISQSVKDLKLDNKQQTKILCRLILKGTVSQRLTPSEISQIEDICKEAIMFSDSELPSVPKSNSSAQPRTPVQTSNPSNNSNAGGSNQVPVTGDTPPGPSVTKRISNFVSGIINKL